MQPLRNSRKSRSAYSSFTLVEVLVAMAVLSILGLILAGMMNQAFKLLSIEQNQAQTLQTLRIVSHMIGQDLQGAVLPVNPTNTTSFQFIQFNPANAGGLTDYVNNDAIFWQTAVVNDTTNSDIACVGYFVWWDTTKSPNNPTGGPQGKLCRFYNISQDTANFATEINTAPNVAWITPALIKNIAPAAYPNYQGLLAENVIGFWVTFEAVDSQGNTVKLTPPFDSRVEGRLPTDAILSYAFISSSAAPRLTSSDVTAIQSAYGNGSYTTNNPNTFIASLPKPLQPVVQMYSTRVLFRRSN